MIQQGQSAMYEIGQHVGYVDLVSRAGPVDLPVPAKWYALITHANRETKVMRTFRRDNVSAYFPMLRNREVKRGRVIDRVVPLFAGIIFIPDFAASDALTFVDGVDRFMRFGDWTAFLTREQMAGVFKLEALGNIPVARRRRLYIVGQDIRVTSGPFAGFNGIVEHLDSRGRLTVLVDIFKRLSPLTLEEGQIEPA